MDRAAHRLHVVFDSPCKNPTEEFLTLMTPNPTLFPAGRESDSARPLPVSYLGRVQGWVNTPTYFTYLWPRFLRMAFVLLLAGWMTGCGSNPSAPPSSSPANVAPSPGSVQAAEAEMNSETNDVSLTKSVFELVPGGKDPFFPNSLRIPSVGTDDPETDTKPRLPLSTYLKITMHRPSAIRPLAGINGPIFEPGEEGTVEVVLPSNPGPGETNVVKIQCLEIRNDSVLIRVEGEPGVKKLILSP